MKKIITLSLLLYVTILTAQNSSSLVIDNVSNQFSNISLPYWLKSGQTIDLGTNAKSVSIIEFTVNGTALEFSQVISLTSVQTVPQNKVWKIEAIGQTIATNPNPLNSNLPSNYNGISSLNNNSLPTIYQSPKKFEIPGTYNWIVPPGITSLCIEVWGGGGGGGETGSGGGGGYGYQCYTVVPFTNLTVTVGAGGFQGVGGVSSVGNLISAFGGVSNGGIGGSTSSTNGTIITINGENGGGYLSSGGTGGNGGTGGISVQMNGYIAGENGTAPGGGGGYCTTNPVYGARGQVYIYW